MAQGTLVKPKIEAGEAFVNELARSLPVKVAFWLKREDESQWYLYVASAAVTDGSTSQAYSEVNRVARSLNNPDLEPFEVKLIGVDHPFAVAAWDILQRYPSRLITLHRESQFGGAIIQGALLYPPPVTASS
jgi:hypothetical protein